MPLLVTGWRSLGGLITNSIWVSKRDAMHSERAGGVAGNSSSSDMETVVYKDVY